VSESAAEEDNRVGVCFVDDTTSADVAENSALGVIARSTYDPKLTSPAIGNYFRTVGRFAL
jgi:hypothetical protein